MVWNLMHTLDELWMNQWLSYVITRIKKGNGNCSNIQVGVCGNDLRATCALIRRMPFPADQTSTASDIIHNCNCKSTENLQLQSQRSEPQFQKHPYFHSRAFVPITPVTQVTTFAVTITPFSTWRCNSPYLLRKLQRIPMAWCETNLTLVINQHIYHDGKTPFMTAVDGTADGEKSCRLKEVYESNKKNGL